MLTVGIKGEQSQLVTNENTAKTMGSGTLDVFATPVGMTVTCESELTAVEGRKLVFKVSLHDEKGPVGGGVHERFIVNDAKFAAKAQAKKG